MFEALKDLMKDEIAEERAKVRTEARDKIIVENARNLMKNMKWTAKQAMEAMGISEADQSKYSALL